MRHQTREIPAQTYSILAALVMRGSIKFLVSRSFIQSSATSRICEATKLN